VLIRSDEAKDVSARLEAALLDRSGQVLGSWEHKANLKPHRATPVNLTITPSTIFAKRRDSRLPAQGVIVLTSKLAEASDADYGSPRSRELLVVQVQPSSAEIIVTFIGVVAAVLLALYGVIVSGRATSNPSDDLPRWSPQSWSTNLAIGGAVLTTVLGITALPAQTHYAARSTYSTFSAFFTALVALAPAIYGLLNVGGPHPPGRTIRLFAIAAAVTVWATIGQLGLAALLFLELGLVNVVSPPAAYAAAALSVLIALLVFVYAARAVAAAANPPATPPSASARDRTWALL
jgi:uncharacterized protein YhhL (DUF1145 family)